MNCNHLFESLLDSVGDINYYAMDYPICTGGRTYSSNMHIKDTLYELFLKKAYIYFPSNYIILYLNFFLINYLFIYLFIYFKPNIKCIDLSIPS